VDGSADAPTIHAVCWIVGRGWLLGLVLAGLCALPGTAPAQQIYKWTDADGKVHFGNQPPPDAKNAVARGREQTEVEVECETEVRAECQEYVDAYGKWQHSEAYRNCMERGRAACLKFKPRAQPTRAAERFISTPALKFDPSLGDSLLCEMRCPSKSCRGQVEIRADRVLKKGENLGSDRYEMEVKPQAAGSAFCSVSTPSEAVELVLSVRRNGSVAAVVEAQ